MNQNNTDTNQPIPVTLNEDTIEFNNSYGDSGVIPTESVDHATTMWGLGKVIENFSKLNPGELGLRSGAEVGRHIAKFIPEAMKTAFPKEGTPITADEFAYPRNPIEIFNSSMHSMVFPTTPPNLREVIFNRPLTMSAAMLKTQVPTWALNDFAKGIANEFVTKENPTPTDIVTGGIKGFFEPPKTWSEMIVEKYNIKDVNTATAIGAITTLVDAEAMLNVGSILERGPVTTQARKMFFDTVTEGEVFQGSNEATAKATAWRAYREMQIEKRNPMQIISKIKNVREIYGLTPKRTTVLRSDITGGLASAVFDSQEMQIAVDILNKSDKALFFTPETTQKVANALGVAVADITSEGVAQFILETEVTSKGDKKRLLPLGLYQSTFHSMQSIEDAVERAKKFGMVILPGEDAGLLARSYLGVNMAADAVLRKGPFKILPDGNIEMTGEGLVPILNDYEARIPEKNREQRTKDFNDYFQSTRIISDLQRKVEVNGVMKTIASPEQTAEAVQKIAGLQAKYGSDFSVFQDIAPRIYDFQKNVLHMLVDGDVISEEMFNSILKSNPHYIPSFRVLEDEVAGVTPKSSGAFTKAKSPIKKIKGSDLETHDSVESIIKNTYVIMDRVARNKVALNVAKLANFIPDQVKVVKVPMVPIKVTAEEIVGKPTPTAKGGEYLYHGTNEDVLDSIIKDGLKPMGRGELSLSRDEAYAKGFAREGMTPKGKTNAVMLRVNADLLKGKTIPTGKSRPASDQLYESLTKETIPPEALEIYKNGKWQSLISAKGGEIDPETFKDTTGTLYRTITDGEWKGISENEKLISNKSGMMPKEGEAYNLDTFHRVTSYADNYSNAGDSPEVRKAMASNIIIGVKPTEVGKSYFGNPTIPQGTSHEIINEVFLRKDAKSPWIKLSPEKVDELKYGVSSLDRIRNEVFSKLSPKEGGEVIPPKVEDITIFRPSPYDPKGNSIEYYEKGKKKFIEVDDNLYKAMAELTVAQSGLLLKILSVPTQLLRVGATITPEFMVKNVIRDGFTAFIQTNVGFIPVIDPCLAIADILGKTDIYDDWLRSGAAYSGLLSLSQEGLKKAVLDLTTTPSVLGKLNLVTTAQEFSAVFETATRLGVFKKAKAAGKSDIEAGFISRESTVDFGVGGTSAKKVNKVIAFFNAQLQGLRTMVKAHQKDPMGTFVKATMAVTIPELALYMAYKDDEEMQELPDWRKDLLYNFKVGDKIWSIPKPIGYAQIYGAMIRRFVEYADGSGFDVKGTLTNLIGTFSPVSVEGDIMSGFLPTGLKPLIENAANFNFFTKSAIVPQGREKLVPSEQYAKNTATTFKEIGKVLNMSPAKLQNLARGLLGGTSGYITDATDFLINSIKESRGEKIANRRPKELGDMPLVKGFAVKSPYANAKSVQTFYDMSKKVVAVDSTYKKMIAEGRDLEARKFKAENKNVTDIMVADFNNAMTNMEAYKKDIDTLIAGKTEENYKLDKIERLEKKRAKEAIKVVKKYKKKI